MGALAFRRSFRHMQLLPLDGGGVYCLVWGSAFRPRDKRRGAAGVLFFGPASGTIARNITPYGAQCHGFRHTLGRFGAGAPASLISSSAAQPLRRYSVPLHQYEFICDRKYSVLVLAEFGHIVRSTPYGVIGLAPLLRSLVSKKCSVKHRDQRNQRSLLSPH